MQCGDIENAFLTAPAKEKVWIKAGPEFGPDEDCIFIVTQAIIYGLKSSAAAFREFFADK